MANGCYEITSSDVKHLVLRTGSWTTNQGQQGFQGHLRCLHRHFKIGMVQFVGIFIWISRCIFSNFQFSCSVAGHKISKYLFCIGLNRIGICWNQKALLKQNHTEKLSWICQVIDLKRYASSRTSWSMSRRSRSLTWIKPTTAYLG